MVLCTAHATSPGVRSAALEELVIAARADAVGTLSKRLLDILQSGQDWRLRVKSLEWINTLARARSPGDRSSTTT